LFIYEIGLNLVLRSRLSFIISNIQIGLERE